MFFEVRINLALNKYVRYILGMKTMNRLHRQAAQKDMEGVITMDRPHIYVSLFKKFQNFVENLLPIFNKLKFQTTNPWCPFAYLRFILYYSLL